MKIKRKLPPALAASRACALELGIKPFVKWTPKQKKDAEACREKKLARQASLKGKMSGK